MLPISMNNGFVYIEHMMMLWHGNAFHITGPLCGEPPVTGGSPRKGPVMWTFDDFFVISLKKLMNKQLIC